MLNDIKAAAAKLGLKPQTLYNWRFNGKGPAVIKMGSRILYRDEDLTKFIEKNRFEPEDH